MSDLLKESIADAKAVRETALANAKIFLEENFAKSMKEMFAEKLKEEMAEEGQVDETLASSGIGGEKGNVASKQHAKKPSTAASKNTTTAGKQEFDVTLEEAEKEEEAEVKTEAADTEEEITSEELDEILAELEGSVTSEAKEEEKEEEDEKEEDDVKKENAESLSEEEEEVSLDEILAELETEEEAAGAEPAPVHTPSPSSPTPTTVPAPGELPPAPVASDVPAAPAPAPAPADAVEGDVTPDEMAEAILALNEENEKLKNSLQEHVKTVKYLKGVLEETNLLNAKLLYTNKLFKGKSLTEDQKMKIINTFDLTKNIREVKLAYTVLAESLNVGGSVAKKKTNATVSAITEGLASKPVSSTKPADIIVESSASEMTSRFQKLAGIKK